jgi:hypothetical protein
VITYWVLALLVTCVGQSDELYQCRMIENSYLGGHTIFLKKEQCLAEANKNSRWSCVGVHEEK